MKDPYFDKARQRWIFKRERWTEWFRIKVSPEIFLAKRWWLPIFPPGNWTKIYSMEDSYFNVYFLSWLAPFVKALRFIKKEWFSLARWFYRKGHLYYREGEAVHWFWIWRIRF